MTPTDAATDAGDGGGVMDAGDVTPTDAATDPGPDAGDSGAPDAGPDAGAGADGDAGPDPDGDGGADGDAGPGDPFQGCPTASAYVGDAGWSHVLDVREGAVYCSTFQETRTLVEELAAKAMLRVAPGAYPLPDVLDGDHAFALPLCMLDADGSLVSFDTGTGRLQSSGTSQRHAFEQRTTLASPRLLSGSLSFESGLGDTLVLDGSEVDISGFDSYSFVLCDGSDQCFGNDALRFDSCTHEGSTLHRHVVTVDGGSVTFELRIGDSFAGTEPGAFVRAHGSFMGTAFDVDDYFRLVYNPEHHHFTRDFAVLFDAPIGGACGLEVGGLEPAYGGGEPANDTADFAWTVDCDLGRLDAVTITDHVHELP